MTEQLTLDFEKSKHNKEIGMQRAVNKADREINDWSIQAYNFLDFYAARNESFLIEDVRKASENQIPEPPHARAWGAIAAKAAKNGIIKRDGYKQVKNVKAHNTPATFWKSNVYLSLR